MTGSTGSSHRQRRGPRQVNAAAVRAIKTGNVIPKEDHLTQQPRFCSQCGASLAEGARFCGQCGQAVLAPGGTPVAAPVSPAAQPAAPDAETILGVIASVQRRKGLFGTETFNIFVTPRRLICSFMPQQMMKDAARQANEQAKREGKNWLGRMAAQFKWLDLVVERYLAMPIETTLAEHPQNFYIAVDQVRKASIQTRRDEERHTHTDHLRLETATGKHEFELKATGPDETRKLLQRVLGSAMK